MQNKQKRIYFKNYEEEEVNKLITDGDVFIKQLVKAQNETKTNLHIQLNTCKQFCKATEFVPLTNYTAGSSTLDEFKTISEHSDKIERLKSFGLSQEEIHLYLNSELGEVNLKTKHRNLSREVLDEKLKEINRKISRKPISSVSSSKVKRLKTELMLSAKPDSVETKLLKFALENQTSNDCEILPHPMDDIKAVEENLFERDQSTINIKKIRKKARSLYNKINCTNDTIKEPVIKPGNKSYSLAHNSKWDVKETVRNSSELKSTKIYTCDPPQVCYTIKDGEIIKLGEDIKKASMTFEGQQLTVEEIKQIPKFENYSVGNPSNYLYLKNISSGVGDDCLKQFLNSVQDVVSVKLMKGKMRGQAFVEFKSLESASGALNQINGKILKNKPIIAQFGRGK